jgi:hypothetical protein
VLLEETKSPGKAIHNHKLYSKKCWMLWNKTNLWAIDPSLTNFFVCLFWDKVWPRTHYVAQAGLRLLRAKIIGVPYHFQLLTKFYGTGFSQCKCMQWPASLQWNSPHWALACASDFLSWYNWWKGLFAHPWSALTVIPCMDALPRKDFNKIDCIPVWLWNYILL